MKKTEIKLSFFPFAIQNTWLAGMLPLGSCSMLQNEVILQSQLVSFDCMGLLRTEHAIRAIQVRFICF